MADLLSLRIAVLRTAYSAFNSRDIDAALATMTGDVSWPKAFKGGFVRGPEEILAYWKEQWGEINPHVDPVAFYEEGTESVLVDVHQVVRDLAGTVVGDDHVGHRFTFSGERIRLMEVVSLPSINSKG
ncbi:MAG TPA: nuclear transport factor 2 family protein [Opitutaceae bacterium]|nr:nuclear transport factor 2 family protein [Opitutaceae bacterium]